MTNRQRLRIGIVGLGAAGRAFLPPIASHAGFELKAFAEPVTETRNSVTAETGVPGFPDLPSMLQGADLDAVYIATPTELHPEHAKVALEAKKHVLTEKPMAITSRRRWRWSRMRTGPASRSWSVTRMATTSPFSACARSSPAANSAVCG